MKGPVGIEEISLGTIISGSEFIQKCAWEEVGMKY